MPYPDSPPLMAPPGWYPDPELAWTWRWWDGSRWTDLRAPQRVPPERDPYSFSAWFEQSVAAVKAVVPRVGLLVLGAWLVVGILTLIGLVVAARSGTGREIRSLLEFDTSFGVAGSGTTVELTDAEIDRLGELFGDLAWWALPWLAVVTLLAILVSAWVTALVARSAERAVAAGPEAAAGRAAAAAVSRTDEAADALRRVPAVLASTLVFGLVMAVVFLLVFTPFILVLALGLGGGAIALAAVFGVLAALALGFYVWVRLSLAPVIAAVGGHGIGMRRSWGLTDGHVWPVAGRLVIVALVAGAISTPLSVVNSIAPFFGLMAYGITLVVVQAVTVAATSLASVPAQVVLARRLGERYAPRLGS